MRVCVCVCVCVCSYAKRCVGTSVVCTYEFDLECGDLNNPGTYTQVPTLTLVISLQYGDLTLMAKFRRSPRIVGTLEMCIAIIHILLGQNRQNQPLTQFLKYCHIANFSQD